MSRNPLSIVGSLCPPIAFSFRRACGSVCDLWNLTCVVSYNQGLIGQSLLFAAK